MKSDDADREETSDYVEGSSRLLSGMILKAWRRRKSKLEHDYAIAGWALSVIPEVMDDVKKRMIGIHRDALEQVVIKLHMSPCPNPNKKAKSYSSKQLIHQFWKEFYAFLKKEEPIHVVARWNSPYITEGQSWLWHEQYSLPYTEVLGFVAVRVTSKTAGIGSTERDWGKVKTIKHGHCSHMSDRRIEMRAVIYGTARINGAQIQNQTMERVDAPSENAMFGDDDIK